MAKLDRSGDGSRRESALARGETTPRRRGASALALLQALSVAGALALTPALSGCRVNEEDIHRWETTRNGPEKLEAVLRHDKYEQALRVEAAQSLIRMKPRQGQYIGIERLLNGLAAVTPETRQAIVTALVPSLIAELRKPPPVAQAGQPLPPDPSFAYKDAAFAMLTTEKAVVFADEAQKQSVREALIDWAMADFEHRLDNKSQLSGMEQLLRYIGAPAVAGLPKLITRDSRKLDQMASLIAELGSPETKSAACDALVKIARFVTSEEWTKIKKPELEAANKASKLEPTPKQFEAQLTQYQDEDLIRIFGSMKRVGARPAVDYLLEFAADKANNEKRRQAALAAVEQRLDHNKPEDIDRVIKIAASDAPDIVLDQAFRRLSEMPRDKVVGKLYDLFKTDKWKVRRAAAGTILRMSKAKDVEEFMGKLPEGDAKGFALGEPLAYGALLGDLKEGAPKDAIKKFLVAPSTVAQRVTAVGFFFTHGKLDDLATLTPLETDTMRAPVCEADDCKWACEVPKEGGKPDEREQKEIKTVGDFVKHCVVPEVKRKAAAPQPKKDEPKDAPKDAPKDPPKDAPKDPPKDAGAP